VALAGSRPPATSAEDFQTRLYDDGTRGDRLEVILGAGGGIDHAVTLLSQAMQRLPQALALYDGRDDEFRVLYMNPAADRLLPHPFSQVKGMPLAVAFPGAFPSAVAAFHDARESGEPQTIAEVPALSAGAQRQGSFNWDVRPILDDSGSVELILATATDVSSLVEARNRLLDAADLGLRTLLEVSRHAEHHSDIGDFFAGVSASVGDLLGAHRVGFARHDPDSGTVEVEGGALAWLDSLPHSMPCREGDLTHRLVFDDLVLRVDLRRQGSGSLDSSLRQLEEAGVSSVMIIGWQGGDERLGLVIALDSEREDGFSQEDVLVLRMAARAAGLAYQRRRAEAQVGEHARQVEQLGAARGDFLRMAAHELRGPVAVLRGYFSMLEQGRLSADGFIQFLPLLDRKLVEMEAMLEKMLESARLEDSRLDLRLSETVLSDVVRSGVDAAAGARRPGQVLELDLVGGEVIVRLDPYRVRLIVSNLLDNAFKYAPDDSPVGCSIEAGPDEFRVRIRDRGPGVPEDSRSRLFRRFERLQATAANVPGTGLGLWLSREIARKHGGDLTLDESSPEGSTFTLHLPRSLASRPELRAESD